MVGFGAALTALGVSAALAAPAASPWVNPARESVLLRAAARADAAATARVHLGETLRVTATARPGGEPWQRAVVDGRSGWLRSSDTRPAVPPRSRDRACASRAIGSYGAGRLVCGRQLRAQGTGFRTWDFPLSQAPSRPQRRWGTTGLVRQIEWIARRWHDRRPLAARLLVGDLSRPLGGPFTARFGGIGHAAHQNGLEVDLYYPRADGAEREPFAPSQVDRRGARELVALILRTRPAVLFVGCRIGLAARGRVQHLCVHHENHVHVRYGR